ncbi:hypothetical protein D9M72_422910 [compost metagenome]
MMSPGRSASWMSSTVWRNTSSPAAWPKLSLIHLKRSRSMNRQPSCMPHSSACRIASSSAPSNPWRLSRPVRWSVIAWVWLRLSACFSAVTSVMTESDRLPSPVAFVSWISTVISSLSVLRKGTVTSRISWSPTAIVLAWLR